MYIKYKKYIKLQIMNAVTDELRRSSVGGIVEKTLDQSITQPIL